MAQTSTLLSAPTQALPRHATSGRSTIRGEVTAESIACPLPFLDRSLKRSILQRLAGLERGALAVKDASGTTRLGRECAHEISAEIDVLDSRFYRLSALGGGVGVAEAYLRGYWRTDDLVAVIRLMARNRHVLGNVGRGWPLLTWPISRLTHFLQRNTKRGSRRNIMAHYDLGNDFFRLFLDDTMTYSSGIFERADSTMEEASRAKYDRICRKLALNRDDHVVEIGTGWGGFAIHAASQYGCRVTTTTISPSQYEYAQRRVAEEGLTDRIDIVLRDYRELSGTYDKLVSIEMIEAVGHEFLPGYFKKCSDLLKPDGTMAIQAITIPDQRYQLYRKSVDFIQRYIFPGGCLPSIGAICDSVRKTTDLKMTHLEDFGQHYAHTLARWRARFFGNLESVRRLGLDDRFIRCWEYYLCYCEGGFSERQIGVAQIVLAKPNSRHQPILPPLA